MKIHSLGIHVALLVALVAPGAILASAAGTGQDEPTIVAGAPRWIEVSPKHGQFHPREECAFVRCGDRFYLLGGRGIKPVDIFDPEKQTWSQGAPPPMEIHHFQAVVWENRIYVACAMTGLYPRETAVGEILIYDPRVDLWSSGGAIPPARRRGSAGAVVHDGKLYLICGIINGHTDGWVNWCDRYDFQNGQWTVLPDAPRTRDHFEAAIVGEKIYGAGGRRTSAVTKQVFDLTIPGVDVYDCGTMSWATLPVGSNLPLPRAGTAAIAVGEEVFVFGGESMAQKPAHAEVQALDTRSGQWRSLPPLVQGRHGTGVVFFDGAFYTCAGSGARGGSPLLNTMETLRIADAAPAIPGVSTVIRQALDAHDIAGAVTVVVTKDKVVHLEAAGFADIAARRPMRADNLFWIASMTKPVTATAILLLQDEGRLNVGDPVMKYLPEFAALRTPSGEPAQVTLAQLLTHTSGLGDPSDDRMSSAHRLADLIPLYLATPMQFSPGARWKFCQSGINTAARIVEVVSGESFDAFVQKRILDPLGMRDTTFYRVGDFATRLATAYAKDATTGQLEPVPARPDVGAPGRPPFGNMGLYSTGPDYARFCQMLLGGGIQGGRRFLSEAAIKLLTTIQTGDLPTGFLQSAAVGSHGANYGWGLGTCILRTPHEGVAAMLSPGSFGHGGGWGTQAWIDPVRGAAYILMVQRSNFGNSDNTEVRRSFQQAAADALPPRPSEAGPP
jgi:CubicO group peptidase (beta-lactamase class C family)